MRCACGIRRTPMMLRISLADAFQISSDLTLGALSATRGSELPRHHVEAYKT